MATDYLQFWYSDSPVLTLGITGDLSSWYNDAPILGIEALPPGEMAGIASFSFVSEGTASATVTRDGTASFLFSTTATLGGYFPIDGTAAMMFGASGIISATGEISGTASVVFSESGDMVPIIAAEGIASFAFSTTGFLGVVSWNPVISTDAGGENVIVYESGRMPCGTKTICTGILRQADDPDSPISNYSAEDPDIPVFNGIVFPPGPNPDDVFYAAYCLGICRSEISQEDADNCAAAAQALCISGQQYQNTAQTCTKSCGSQIKSYTVAANSFVSSSLLQANALAYQFACTAVNLICSGVPPELIPSPPTPRVLVPNSPQSCTVPCALGGTHTHTVPASTFWGYNQAETDAKAKSQACTAANQHPSCLSNLTPSGYCLDAQINATISLSNPPSGKLNWSYLSNLPSEIEITFSGTSARIKGTASTVGTFQFVIQVTDSAGNKTERTYTLRVANIKTESPLPEATEDEAYTATLEAEGGYITPLSWQLKSGDILPPGLVLNEETGEISGTPTNAGDFTFTIVLQDAAT